MRKWIDLFESNEVSYTFANGPETVRMMQDVVFDDDHPYLRIPYFQAQEAYHESHFIAWLKGRVIGVGGMQTNPYNKTELWGKFVGVDPLFRDRGIGGTLIRKMIDYAHENGQVFVPSSYTQDGEIKMKPIVDGLSPNT